MALKLGVKQLGHRGRGGGGAGDEGNAGGKCMLVCVCVCRLGREGEVLRL